MIMMVVVAAVAAVAVILAVVLVGLAVVMVVVAVKAATLVVVVEQLSSLLRRRRLSGHPCYLVHLASQHRIENCSLNLPVPSPLIPFPCNFLPQMILGVYSIY